MMHVGDIAFGYKWDENAPTSINTDKVECVYQHVSLFQLDFEKGKELAQLMSSFYRLKATELTDRELINELKSRGYHGALNLEIEL